MIMGEDSEKGIENLQFYPWKGVGRPGPKSCKFQANSVVKSTFFLPGLCWQNYGLAARCKMGISSPYSAE